MSRFSFKTSFLAIALVGAAAALAGCTSAEESAAVSAVGAACTAAKIGTTIYVQVESSQGGATAQNIAQNVSADTATDCDSVVAGATAAVNSVVASGNTATVTVETSAPATSFRRKIARLTINRAGLIRSQVFVVTPGLHIPFIGDVSL